VPNQNGLINGSTPFLFGATILATSCPTLKTGPSTCSGQAAEDTVFTIGYAGNHGVHLTQPIPSTSPDRHARGIPSTVRFYSYGYTPFDHNDPTYPNCTNGPPNPPSATLLTGPLNTSTGGNTDLRSPYLGFIQTLSSGLRMAFPPTTPCKSASTNASSTDSKSPGLTPGRIPLDDQSGLGLFYNGNNPLQPHTPARLPTSIAPRRHHPSLLRTAPSSRPKILRRQTRQWMPPAAFWSSRVASRTTCMISPDQSVVSTTAPMDFITNPVVPPGIRL